MTEREFNTLAWLTERYTPAWLTERYTPAQLTEHYTPAWLTERYISRDLFTSLVFETQSGDDS